MSSFGTGLGELIGGGLASSSLSDAAGQFGQLTNQDLAIQQPYMDFGSAFLQPTNEVLLGSNGSGAGSNPTIGLSRLQGTGNDVTSFEDFAKNYDTSAGAKYLMGTADAAENNSAAARGGLLSGANLRQLGTINTGIANQDLLSQYQSYLSGNQQQFTQLQGALSDQFQGIGVGQAANAQFGSVLSADMQAQAQMAAAQAQAQQSKGNGIGSMLGGLGGMLAMF
jgi:hypothetical protein